MYESLSQSDLTQQLHSFLPAAAQQVLSQAASIAATYHWRLFLVGGTVRDMLLGRPASDLDLVVEGNAIILAEQLAAATAGHVTRHEAFGTAEVRIGMRDLPDSELILDLVTARAEHYPEPAVLPVVQPADLNADLWRRDLSINAMAISLNAADYGALADPTGGLSDLQQRQVRVLHDHSFRDDPTRILRALRLSARLGCTLNEATQRQMQQAIEHGMLQATSPARIQHELLLIFAEPDPTAVFAVLAHTGALSGLHGPLRWNWAMQHWYAAAQSLPLSSQQRSILGVALLVWPLASEQRASFCEHFAFDAATQRVLRDLDPLHVLLPELADSAIRPSALDRMLHKYEELALVAAQIAAPAPSAGQIRYYLNALRPQQIGFDGNDLQAIGLRPGPQFRVLLAGLRGAYLDGEATTREQQIAWVKRIAGIE
jgi:tRNA nucleotidyltransferase (CCA-adding enzyme)